MWAVAQMKEGKKVGLKRHKLQRPIMFGKSNISPLDLIYKVNSDDTTSKEIIYINGVECRVWHPSILELEAIDWEVIDKDEDWNYHDEIKAIMTNTASGFYNEQESVLKHFKAKDKCRDLILKDIESYCLDMFDGGFPIGEQKVRVKYFVNFINKRFGELK